MAKPKNPKPRMSDFELAMALAHEEYHPVGLTENAVFPDNKNKENYQPRTLVDQTLEIIDPTPNIYTLFLQFNTRFFSNKLMSAEVKWSKRMTSCAGTCTFSPRSRYCVISLSAPLLKLRPRKDLIETLLHEMIHGYLFLTNNNRDRDGHGPEFCKHMDRINKEAGTHITIYHSFHDEVRLYQQHWWRCNGPCQKRHPYFGMVRRAMNRAPGPSDSWWRAHQQSCGGEYIKVREPEKQNGKWKSPISNGKEVKKPDNKSNGAKTIDGFLTKPGVKPANGPTSSKSNGGYQPTNSAVNNHNSGKSSASSTAGAAGAGLVKLGTATNNVHGWGTGGPGSSSGKSPGISKTNSTGNIGKPSRPLNFVGSVGGAGTGRSCLLDKFFSPTAAATNRPPKKHGSIISLDTPPAKKHGSIISLDTPPARKHGSTVSLDTPLAKKPKIVDSNVQEMHNCPVCNALIPQSRLNAHLDECLSIECGEFFTPPATGSQNSPMPVVEILSSPESPTQKRVKPPSTPKIQTNLDGYLTSPKKTATKRAHCPVCEKSFEIHLLNEHLDDCLTEPKENTKTSPAGPSRPAKPDNFVETQNTNLNESYVCLVCNSRINGDIALNDHLDECVQAIFNDDSIVDDYNNSVNLTSPEKTPKEDAFPCPICMKLVPERSMNAHVDDCLCSENWE